MILLNINISLNRTFGVLWLPSDDCSEYTYISIHLQYRTSCGTCSVKVRFFIYKYMNYTDKVYLIYIIKYMIYIYICILYCITLTRNKENSSIAFIGTSI